MSSRARCCRPCGSSTRTFSRMTWPGSGKPFGDSSSLTCTQAARPLPCPHVQQTPCGITLPRMSKPMPGSAERPSVMSCTGCPRARHRQGSPDQVDMQIGGRRGGWSAGRRTSTRSILLGCHFCSRWTPSSPYLRACTIGWTICAQRPDVTPGARRMTSARLPCWRLGDRPTHRTTAIPPTRPTDRMGAAAETDPSLRSPPPSPAAPCVWMAGHKVLEVFTRFIDLS